jgi:hypothetical protein
VVAAKVPRKKQPQFCQIFLPDFLNKTKRSLIAGGNHLAQRLGSKALAYPRGFPKTYPLSRKITKGIDDRRREIHPQTRALRSLVRFKRSQG